ncbi:hypothetical protein NQ318_018191 [Aromia moschata]|uniref:Nucleoside diphosphate kinase-like domain-containing protein n=1 Tax=Aromia moschata TaxID=1265417 RepID=A0AAV8ZEX0_9CUCU|nr:hypothetical protein NQ318_018191 [Aromia moschata]
MDDVVYVSPVDKIALLRTGKDADQTNLNTFRTGSYGSSTDVSSQRDILDDTIHYLSPATTGTARTEVEGDFYRQFLEYRPSFPPALPDYGSSISSSISCEEPDLQRTIAIIKPEAIKYKDVVLRTINASGLRIVNAKKDTLLWVKEHGVMRLDLKFVLIIIEAVIRTKEEVYHTDCLKKKVKFSTPMVIWGSMFKSSQRVIHLSPEQVSEIYAQHYGSPAFPQMVVSMSISPLMVLSLAGLNAVEKWKTMVGPYGLIREEWFYPYSVRTRFGLQADIPDVVHASENIPEGKKENRYFYPRSR